MQEKIGTRKDSFSVGVSSYGVECLAALHHNKKKSNYHIHLIFSERKLLKNPIEKVAKRNMYYNEFGKKVRTKKKLWKMAN